MQRIKLLIIGAGPAGLGAALRWIEHGESSLLIVEASPEPGGLASSIIDDHGFTWDLGSHLQFSHYEKFDSVLNAALPASAWLHHDRSTWIRLGEDSVPYPFQHNLHRLSPAVRWDCVSGLLDAANANSEQDPSDFRTWIYKTFGAGIADHFLCPYNSKIWAWPLDDMSYKWIGERVAVPDLQTVMKATCLQEDNLLWGPNAKFRYPDVGGTGGVWQAVSELIPNKMFRFRSRITEIDAELHLARSEDGGMFQWDHLISTLPLDRLDQILTTSEAAAACHLRHTQTHIVGLGLRGSPPKDLQGRFWYYIPDPAHPCYRVTCLSNLSSRTTPRDSWSLMVEVAESALVALRNPDVVNSCIAALYALKLLPHDAQILSRWHHVLPHGYPIPTLNRDSILNEILPPLRERGIYSRGRFGAWKYEVSNQDHSFMQGFEAVEHLINGNTELTLEQPDLVNSRYNPFPFQEWTGQQDDRLSRGFPELKLS